MSEGVTTLSALSEDELMRHVRFVQALARELVGDAHAADDLAQETWTCALAFAPRSRERLRAWLATIVRHTASKLARGERRRMRRERSAIANEPTTASSAELAARLEAHQRVVRAVQALPEPYHATVVLRYFSGLSARAIADQHGVPLETVRSRLKRAIELLRQELDHSFGDRALWCAALASLARSPAGTGTAPLLASVLTLMTSTTKIGLATLAALAITGTAWLCLRSDRAAEQGPARSVERTRATDEPTAHETTRSPIAASTREPSSANESENGLEVAVSSDSPFQLRGRIGVLEGRSPVTMPLTLHLQEEDEADSLLQSGYPIEFVADQQADITAGEPFAIPVARAGEFRARVGSPRAANQVCIDRHSTQAPAKYSVTLAPSVTLRLSGLVPADLEVVPSYLGDGGYRDGTATHADAGEWRVAGPVFLPLRLTLRSASWPAPWQLNCRTPEISAALPALTRTVLVRDAETRKPLPRAQVTITSLLIVAGYGGPFWQLELTSDALGLVAIPGQGSLRSLRMSVAADTYETLAAASPDHLVADEQGRLVVDLRRARASQSRCQLVDREGRPVVAARVVVLDESAYPTGFGGVTGPEGRFALAWPGAPARPLPPGDPRVIVLESDRTASVLGPVARDELSEGRWRGVLEGPRLPVRVELVDEKNGKPVRGAARLLVANGGLALSEREIPSDGEGRVSLGAVRGGPWMLSAQAEGFLPTHEVITPPESGSVRVALRRPVDRLLVRVVDTRGLPRAGLEVHVFDPSDIYVSYEGITDRDGRAIVGVPHPGEYEYYLAIAPDAAERESVANPDKVRVGEGELALRIVPTLRVPFDIRFADGSPPDPALINTRGPDGRRHSTNWGWTPSTPECSIPDEPCELEIAALGAKTVKLPFPGTWDRESPIRVTLERE